MVNVINKDGEHKTARPVKNREEYLALRNAAENAKNFYDARAGNEVAKANQMEFNYNDLLPDGVLRGCCHPSSTFAHDIDCDSQEEQTRIKNVLLEKKDEIGLLELSGSARYGLHAVCRRELGKTVRECQYALSIATKTEYDTNSRGLARVMYTGPATPDNLFYLDDAIFEEPLTVEESEAEYKRLKERERKNEEEVPAGAKKANKHYRPWEDAHSGDGSRCVVGTTQEKRPREAETSKIDERTRFIAEGVMKEKGLEAQDFLDTGGRHTTVKIFLTGATQLLTKQEVNGVLQELMPEHWADANIQQLVNDFYQNYTKPNQPLLKYQEALFVKSRRSLSPNPSQNSEAGLPLQSELSKLFASNRPPEPPAVLPKLVKVALQSTPKCYKATVAQAIFPALATYPKKLSFVYIDNLVRELRINCLIVAPSGTGKDVCTKQPLQHILADMKERDEMNRQRLKKFNDEYNAKAGNKQKPQRPDDLVIQTIKSDITRAALVQRMDEAQQAPLYVGLNELEQWDKIECATGRNNQFTVLKQCDDEGNDFGSDRASTQSVMASGSLHLNWCANTTIPKVMKYFKNVLTDGPISRLCLATIAEQEIGADIAVFGEYDSDYDAALKPFIDNLKAATGVIDCPQAKRLARRLKDECAEFAQLSQDRVFDNLSHRALAAVFRKACLLYAANGMKWEKAIETFCRWSLFYDMYLKMALWGDLIRQANEDVPTSKRGPQSLLELLPEEFTIEDAKRVRMQRGINNDGYKCQNMINQWVYRKRILQITDYSFKKVPKEGSKV